MKNRLYLTAYCILLGYSMYARNVVLILSVVIVGILILAMIPIYKNYRKNSIKNGAILNVNKASWWEFEQLPGFKRVSAKKAVWMRKHNGKYLSKNDFYLKNDIKNIEQIENIIDI